MKEYKIAKGWAIAIYIFAPLLLLLFCWLLVMPFLPGTEMDTSAVWILMPVSIIMILLIIAGLWDTVNGKFVIDVDKIYIKSALSSRELLFTEIKGYRINDKFILIEPSSKAKKRIKVSDYFGKKEEIMGWLSARYPDLDVVSAAQEHEEILHNESFGFTEAEREARLQTARKWAKGVNIAGVIVGLWVFIYPHPYVYAIVASFVFPLIALIVMKQFNGLIRINEGKGTAYPSIISGFLVSAMALCVRALIDFNIFNYAHVWMPAVAIAIILIGLLLWKNVEFSFRQSKDYILIAFFLVVAFGYGYGAIVEANCLLDDAQPQVFHAKVLSKRISTGKHTTYYLELAPWGQQREADEVSVSSNLYDALNTNDTATIYFQQGKYDIPWFDVTE